MDGDIGAAKVNEVRPRSTKIELVTRRELGYSILSVGMLPELPVQDARVNIKARERGGVCLTPFIDAEDLQR